MFKIPETAKAKTNIKKFTITILTPDYEAAFKWSPNSPFLCAFACVRLNDWQDLIAGGSKPAATLTPGLYVTRSPREKRRHVVRVDLNQRPGMKLWGGPCNPKLLWRGVHAHVSAHVSHRSLNHRHAARSSELMSSLNLSASKINKLVSVCTSTGAADGITEIPV